MTNLFKYLKHIEREVGIYFIPGLILLIFIYFQLKQFSLIHFNLVLRFKIIWFVIPFISYALGHILVIISEVFSSNKNNEFLKEVYLYNNHNEIYNHFIERYNLLLGIRKNLNVLNIIILLFNLFILTAFFKSGMSLEFNGIIFIVNLLLIIPFKNSCLTKKNEFKDRIIKLYNDETAYNKRS